MADISLQTKKETSDKTRQAESLFKSFMKEQGLRCTTERIAVLRELYRSNTHLDADEIFIRLKKKQVGISRATVYHTLNLLFKFHLVSKIDLGHKHTHYEKSHGVTNHLHIICEKCGNVVEVSESGLSELLDRVCRENGFELGSFSLQVFGKCVGNCDENCPKQK
ncbi:Fur family transcriptional regulator [Chlorobium phaeobacteroides]|jgi:Fur family ferric uptake transcriptional regulator|uniref:Ferric uptake regulation protein n=1 Tax=Chlorobium phaeobacteroides (strain DSM 266 / SMG 266 / 2430) TaxID=290317 RepID=A1BD99_CHLPD|nr:transcriptional repressor [Chlorobium phaeobacteroides]ABL64376.1 ferric uptake regulator, Fur family [Chlorobium phaeobacteroides DSM 266]MBV5320006.1 transcriptional repressor [Chlorobium phaeobacteroides]